MRNLVIVESPTKARTLSQFLGDKYQIVASMGHIRDLPKSDLGVDIKHDFEPLYVIPRAKRKQVGILEKQARDADHLYLATDPDREGEAIAWHINQLLNAKTPVKKQKIDRIVFHEITKEAVGEAFANPRNINFHLVDAQQARRVLDRIVGYKLSPLLWKKVRRGLSAGRVQSVAVRLIVDREREIEKFKPREYWTIEAELEKIAEVGTFPSRPLNSPQPLADQPRNFRSQLLADRLSSTRPGSDSTVLEVKSPSPQPRSFTALLLAKDGKKIGLVNEQEAKVVEAKLQSARYKVDKISQKQLKKYPAPPFTTSTLQQTAANRFGFSAKKTMAISQELYEHGLITYMRTDSVHLADSAVANIRSYIDQNFGKSYLPAVPRKYRVKSKVAQEAHEAIRPTNIQVTSDKLPADAKAMAGRQVRSNDHRRLYDLIWRRTIACQMAEALIEQKTVDVKAESQAAIYALRTTGATTIFTGWHKVFEIKNDELEIAEEKILPKLKEGETLQLIDLKSEQHFSQPPDRYTEATLIKTLEAYGIGRPSTYAPIISTILERYYVEKIERKFHSTSLGVAVNDFLVANFPDVVDLSFTAEMEESLDEIARGERPWRPMIGEFYGPFEKHLTEIEETAKRVAVEVEKTDEICELCGKPMVIRIGRYGRFLACSGFPECKNTKALVEKIDILCPKDGGTIVIRKTKRGRPFYGCENWPKCDFASWTKPKAETGEQNTEEKILS